MLFLAFGEADLDLDAAFGVMHVERDEGVAGALDRADQLVDLARVEEELAGAGVVRLDMGRSGRERRDVRADEEDLAVVHDDVSLLDLHASGAYRLGLPPFEDDAGLELFLDEIVVEGFLVLNDTHGWLPWRRILTVPRTAPARRRRSGRRKIGARRPLGPANVRARRRGGGLP